MSKEKTPYRSNGGNPEYSDYPIPDGRVGTHKPRRNYWGNLYDEDTFDEEDVEQQNYDYSDYDSEDSGDSYYNSDSYD